MGLVKAAEEFQKTYKIRVLTAMIMLATALYFQISLRTIQALYCKDVDGEKRLGVEMVTRCFTGTHKTLTGIAITILVIYVAGFPVTMALLMGRAYYANAYLTLKNTFAFLTRGLRVRFWWFRLLSLLSILVLAVQTTVVTDAALQLFVAGLTFLVNVSLVAVLWPYKVGLNNVFQIVVGFASSLQAVFFLNASGFGDLDDDLGESLQIALIVVIVVVFLLLVSYRGYHICKASSGSSTTSIFSCSGCLRDDSHDDEWLAAAWARHKSSVNDPMPGYVGSDRELGSTGTTDEDWTFVPASSSSSSSSISDMSELLSSEVTISDASSRQSASSSLSSRQSSSGSSSGLSGHASGYSSDCSSSSVGNASGSESSGSSRQSSASRSSSSSDPVSSSNLSSGSSTGSSTGSSAENDSQSSRSRW